MASVRVGPLDEGALHAHIPGEVGDQVLVQGSLVPRLAPAIYPSVMQ